MPAATVITPVRVLNVMLPAKGAALVSVATGMLALVPSVTLAVPVPKLTVSLTVTAAVVVPLAAGMPG